MDSNGSAAALATIKSWDWERFDLQSGFDCPHWRPLNEVVNSLAMAGHSDPNMAVLQLMCEGGLVARGDYEWQAFRDAHYSKAEHGQLPASWWSMLHDGLAKLDWRTANTMNLLLLENPKAPVAEWAWKHDRFAVACMKDDDFLATGYAEELICVWSIEVYCPSAGNDNLQETQPDEPAGERNKGGAPCKYDWERAVAAVVFAWAEEGSWQPASQAEVKSRLGDWFSAQNQHPSDSLLKERARWLYQEFQRREGEANNLAA